ncbi:replication factor C large subunit [Candidatus Woesearchaeota archaeon]|nr:replication factor C large subunit [Candidatus Woesearchaeota archaeon]
MWTHKYAPQTTADIVGQDIAPLKAFVQKYPGRKRAALLHGPSGCGKTASVHALARELGYELLEVNASDTRNAESLQTILGSASKQRSLFGTSKIILVDELDGLSGMHDRGGVGALVKLIEESAFPIILTTGDQYDRKIASLKTKCEALAFTSIPIAALVQLLARIAIKEGIRADEAMLRALARRAGGDARAAILDLQTLAGTSQTVTAEGIATIGERTQIESMMQALMKIFKTTDVPVAAAALDTVEEDEQEIMLWIDENLPKEYRNPSDLARAYDALSKADVFSSRIRRWQYWRLLVYVRMFLSVGIALSKDNKYAQFVSYGPTRRILKIWRSNMKNAHKKSIAEKIGGLTHCSVREATRNVPYFRRMKAEALEELELTPEELGWLHS